jgi:hypothetical protein
MNASLGVDAAASLRPRSPELAGDKRLNQRGRLAFKIRGPTCLKEDDGSLELIHAVVKLAEGKHQAVKLRMVGRRANAFPNPTTHRETSSAGQ